MGSCTAVDSERFHHRRSCCRLVFVSFSWTHWNGLGLSVCHYVTLCCCLMPGFCRQIGSLSEAIGKQTIVCYRPIRCKARVEAELLVDGFTGFVSVAFLCYRGVLLVQLVDQLHEVGIDARSQVLLVQRRPVTTDALDGGFV